MCTLLLFNEQLEYSAEKIQEATGLDKRVSEMKQEVRKMQGRVNDLEAKNLRLATENFDMKVQMRNMENQHVMDSQADQDKIIELEQVIGFLQMLNSRVADAQ
ncbi:unnamed protein product [Caenorhabditis nigoni]